MKRRLTKNFEWSILICTILLIIIGLFAIFTATASYAHEEFKKQLIWLVVGIPIFILFMFVDYDTWAKLSPIFYGISIILLLVVLFTNKKYGATSWLNIGKVSIQPAEFSKVSVIMFISFVMSRMLKKGGIREKNRPTRLLILLLIFAIPVGLILKQPDIGTATAFVVAFVLMLFNSGIYRRYIITALAVVIVALPLTYFFILPKYAPHAKTRIDVFLNPDLDPRGAGYNITQSKLAIGAGELFGMGYMKGNQTQLGFLYPKSTDFIFSVIGEEMGFLVAAIIIIIYVVLITKSIYVAKTAKDDLGSLIAIGIAGVFLFHMAENIGMTIGLLPITGVPLPFVSYGGSSLLSNLIMIALLLNISGKRQKAIFIE